MSKGRPSFAKREREKAKREKQQKKAARRAERQPGAPRQATEGEDPDIAGIRLGPQPVEEE